MGKDRSDSTLGVLNDPERRAFVSFPCVASVIVVLLLLATGRLVSAQEEGKDATGSESPKEMAGPDKAVEVEPGTADSKIRERLRRILGSAECFVPLAVEVRNGLVFLSGATTETAYKHWATEIARKTEDVVAVINDIEVNETPIRWWEALSHLLHLAIAYVLALPIAWDRERQERSAGLRTFPLVSVASCGYMLIALFVLEGSDAQARVMYGIITGIGFIGGGAILKDKVGVHGTATAASIWNTAAIGVAVAWKHFEVAIVLSLVNFVTLRCVADLKSRVRRGSRRESARDDPA